MILQLDVPPATVLSFNTPVVQHVVSLAEIADGPVVVEAEGIDIKVFMKQEKTVRIRGKKNTVEVESEFEEMLVIL